jgi:hypothetical protein
MLLIIFQQIIVPMLPLTPVEIALPLIIRLRWHNWMKRFVSLRKLSRLSFKKRVLVDTISLVMLLTTPTILTIFQEMLP